MDAQLKQKSPGFRITDGKGLHLTFENGWTVSLQFGAASYADNYDAAISREGNRAAGEAGSTTAEIAAWDENGNWIEDSPRGWQSPAKVLEFMNEIAGKTCGERPMTSTQAKTGDVAGKAAGHTAGAYSRYTSEFGPNVENILTRGTRVIRGTIPRQVRSQLMAAVKAKVLGRLKKDGLKPEIFFHPDHLHGAVERQRREAEYSIGCIATVIAVKSASERVEDDLAALSKAKGDS